MSGPVRLTFSASVAKGADPNEDRAEWDESSGTFVLSDGASESYDPGRWAELVAERALRRPDPDLPWLADAAATYAAAFDPEAMSWSQSAAYTRGSFSTLLVVRVRADEVEVLAVGDSLAALLDEGRVVETFPYRSPDQFDARPTLIATTPSDNAFLARESVEARTTRWMTANLHRPTVMCMTDALGRWFLEREGSPDQLLALSTREEFAAFVADERAAGRLRADDTTLLRIEGRPDDSLPVAG